MTPAAIHLHINRLVLDGFASLNARDRRRLATALERELGQLLARAPDSLAGMSDGDRARLQAPVVLLPRDADATHIGRALADSLYDALTGVTASAKGR
jgi:hypothetical protein